MCVYHICKSDFTSYCYHLILFQDDDSDLVHLTNSIKQLIKCFKCKRQLDLVSGPILCSQRPGTKCSFLASSKIIAQMMRILPKPCSYSDQGCPNVSLAGSHESICEFRTIKCLVTRETSCSWSGTVKEWKEHVQSIHKVNSQYARQPQCAHSFNQEWNMDYEISQAWDGDCIYHNFQNKVFLFVMKKRGNKVLFAARYVPEEKVNHDVYLMVHGSTGDSYRNAITLFKTAVKAIVLGENESLESIECEFYGLNITDIKEKKLYVKFEIAK